MSQTGNQWEENMDPELLRRIELLERPEEQGAGFTSADYIGLLILGILLPIVVSLWGLS